jgi:hypothetical protein
VKAAGHGGQVLVTEAIRDLVGRRLGGGFGLKRLGEFRLRDLAEPELICQLTHADLPADFPPLATVAERTGNLPVQVSSFIGRARELEQVAAALAQARVVTLTGPGGVGKTRLALQAAGQTAERFADGAWLAELAPVRDPAGVDDAVAAVFSVTARAPAMTAAELARRLERSFAVLAAGPRGAVARHQTLRATIDWSFQLLAGPEQILLARLAVFVGGATLEAAEAVCGGEGIDRDAVFELLACWPHAVRA